METLKAEFKPTLEMVSAAELVFKTMAAEQTIRPIVERYQKEILDYMKPKSTFDGAVITDIKQTYEMNDDDFKLYLARCNSARIKAGLHVDNDEYCPLLVAENLRSQTERLLVDTMQPVTGITAERAIISGLDNYKKVIDLTLRLLARFVKGQRRV